MHRLGLERTLRTGGAFLWLSWLRSHSLPLTCHGRPTGMVDGRHVRSDPGEWASLFETRAMRFRAIMNDVNGRRMTLSHQVLEQRGIRRFRRNCVASAGEVIAWMSLVWATARRQPPLTALKLTSSFDPRPISTLLLQLRHARPPRRRAGDRTVQGPLLRVRAPLPRAVFPAVV